jgi:hypothetical protein
MRTYHDHWFDVTVERDYCNEMFDCEIQLYSDREVALVKASGRSGGNQAAKAPGLLNVRRAGAPGYMFASR